MGQLWSRAVGGHEDNNQSPIAVAIRDNNSQEVSRLLKEGVIEEEEEPLLCLAARLGHKECVIELLNIGNKKENSNLSLDLNQEDRSGFSPLVLAVYGGHTDVVVALTKSGVDLNKLCTSGATAFSVALITGKVDIAEILMKQLDFDTKRIMEPCMSSGGRHGNQYKDENPLLMYCRRLNLPAVKTLVRGGHALDVVDSEGKGALWYATLPNRRGFGRHLGFDVLIRRVRGDIEPELRGELVKLLVSAGVRVNQGVLDNLSTSLPSLRMEAERWMRTPPSLLTCARSALWAAVREGNVRNARCGVEKLIEEHLPSSLAEFLLFESVS